MSWFYRRLIPRALGTLGFAFRAPEEPLMAVHNDAMVNEGTEHLHDFTGLVTKTCRIGVFRCKPPTGEK